MIESRSGVFLYNLQETQPGYGSKFHGGATYMEVVFCELVQKCDSARLVACYDSSRYISPDIKKACEEKRISLIDVLQENVPSIIQRLNVSVVYPASASVCAQVPASAICANTEHGPRLLEKYADAYEWMYETSILKKSKAALRFLLQRWIWPVKKEKERRGLCFPGLRLITVSEHSKYSMLSLFPDCAACKAMPVFYSPLFESVSGSDIDFAPLPEGIKEKGYFLIVSGNRWIKNPLRAALAFDKLAGQGQLTKKIVITGVTHPDVYTKRLKHLENFIFLNYVDRSLLNSLHRSAYALFYPSLNEGFGYPPIESMKYGVPVAASGVSSIPEICGDAALYFDPYNILEMSNRVLQLGDPFIYAKLQEKGMARYALVSERQKRDLNSLVNFLLAL